MIQTKAVVASNLREFRLHSKEGAELREKMRQPKLGIPVAFQNMTLVVVQSQFHTRLCASDG